MLKYKIIFLLLFSVSLFAHEDFVETSWENPDYFRPGGNVPVSYPSLVEERLQNEYIDVTDRIMQDGNNLEEMDISAPPKEAYRLRLGDVMLISLYGEEKSQQEVAVDPTGAISFLFVNSLPVLGKTIEQVRSELEEKLKTYFRHVLLAITPIQFAEEYYTVMGEVNFPGKKILSSDTTLLTALCESAGLTTRVFRDQTIDQSNLEKSFLSRNGEYVPVDFVRLIRDGDLSQDVKLEAGDYVYIHNREMDQVFVLGEVLGPTTIDYLNTFTLTQAITYAGGVTLRASSRAVVLRGSLSCPIRYLIDINRIFKGKACDFILQPGDIVYVPPRRFENLRLLALEAISSFVLNVFSTAGVNAYLHVQPDAVGEIVGPVPTVFGGAAVVVP